MITAWELRKLLSGLVYPLGTSALLLGIGIFAFFLLRRRRTGITLAFTALIWLWIWSTPVVSDLARSLLEERWDQVTAEDTSSAGAIAVLGGAFSHDEKQIYPNASAAVDRYWHAARLFKAGKAKKVIISGGRSPGRGPGMTEAAAGRLFLIDLGVPDEFIVLEQQSLTTRGNAVHVAELLNQYDLESVLLVTSALHMRRSMAAFQAVGLDPVPAATDFEVSSNGLSVRDFLPSAAALAGSTRAVHEWVGYWVYRWRGWA